MSISLLDARAEEEKSETIAKLLAKESTKQKRKDKIKEIRKQMEEEQNKEVSTAHGGDYDRVDGRVCMWCRGCLVHVRSVRNTLRKTSRFVHPSCITLRHLPHS